jgi:hypothetical protein
METVEEAVDVAAVPVSTACNLRRGEPLPRRGLTIAAGRPLFDEPQDLTAGTARAGGSRPEGGPGCASA